VESFNTFYWFGLVLFGLAGNAVIDLPANAAGNGVIVLQRTVQPVPIGRSNPPDPNPTTVNANPSARIHSIMDSTELSDGDFASVSSGAAIRSNSNQNGILPGLNIVTNPNGLPGMTADHGGGSGSAISGTINRAMSTGLAPLGRLAGGQ
jgi:hypothetical protein